MAAAAPEIQNPATQLAAMALRLIGATSVEDEGAPREWLQTALDWLDVEVRHLAGTSRALWLVQRTIDLPLSADSANYSLVPVNLSAEKNLILQGAQGGTALRLNEVPDEGIQFPIRASVYDSRADEIREEPVKIYRRWEFDEIQNKSASGIPRGIFIDRSIEPVMTVYPVPADDYSVIRLTFQSFAAAVEKLGQQRAAALRTAWDSWAIHATAVRLGSGAIKVLPANRLIFLKGERDTLRDELRSFENDDHYRPRISMPNE